MKPRHWILLLCLLGAAVSFAGAPTPPGLVPVPAPSGWDLVFDAGFDDVRQSCVSDLVWFEGKYYLGFQRAIDSSQSSSASAALLVSDNGANWQPLMLDGISQQVFNHRFVNANGQLYDLPGYWRGKQVLLKLTPEGELSPVSTFGEGQHYAFSHKMGQQWVFGFNKPRGIELWLGDAPETLRKIDLPEPMPDEAAFTAGQAEMVWFADRFLTGLSGIKGGGLLTTANGLAWQVIQLRLEGTTASRPLVVFEDKLFVISRNEHPTAKQAHLQLTTTMNLVDWQPLPLPSQFDQTPKGRDMAILVHGDWLYTVVNHLPEHSYAQQTQADPPVARIMRFNTGQGWEELPGLAHELGNAHYLGLYQFGDDLFLIASDYDGYDQIWQSADGNKWRQIYRAVNSSGSLMHTPLFHSNDKLFLALCDRVKGASLWHYPLHATQQQQAESAAASAITTPDDKTRDQAGRALLWGAILLLLILMLYLRWRKHSRRNNPE